MGITINRSLIVHSFNEELLKKTRKSAKNLFWTEFSKVTRHRPNWTLEMISKVRHSMVNGFTSFYIAPASSKLDWAEERAERRAYAALFMWIKMMDINDNLKLVFIEFDHESEKFLDPDQFVREVNHDLS